ncbi:hypothetical protein KKA24_01365 [Patescibacteria group bacterium]|nr:hypothetical protein [Patescibacteria group bacterium]
MPEENNIKVDIKKPLKKKGKWFQKIPAEVLGSPGGMILLFFAGFMEIIDVIPLFVLDQVWELPLEMIFIALFMAIVPNASLKSLIIPFVIERIPVLSDVIPSFLLKMFM